MYPSILTKWLEAGALSIPKLLMHHYRQLSLDEQELVALLHIQTFIEEGSSFPTPDDLASRMSLASVECSKCLNGLIKKGCLALEKRSDEEGVIYEQFSLSPLWEKLAELVAREIKQLEEKHGQEEEMTLYRLFEREFSRPLSPIEGETLSMWIDQDQHTPELIKAALREAVISGKLNFRYIDRILFEWKKNGVTTLDQAKKYGEKFRTRQDNRPQDAPRTKANVIPTYNWLDQ